MRKKALSLALALALCLGLAAPALAAESPKISWLPEELHPWRNPEIDELEAPLTSELVLVFTGTFNPQWGSWDHQKFGLADKTGKLVTPIEYDYFTVFSDELICGTKDRKEYLIDKNDGSATPMDMECYLGQSAGDGLITAYSYSREPDYIYKYGFVDKTGKLVVPLVYDSVSEFSEGLARVSNGEWGSAEYAFVDKTGKVVLDLGKTYQSVDSFSEGLAVVGDRNGKYGAIDQSGRLVIPMEYDWLYNFSNGLAAAGKETGTNALGYPIYEVGFIDKTGAVVVPFNYSTADSFSDGLAVVGVHSGYALSEFYGDEYVETYKYGLIDASEKIVVPLVYDSISFEWGNTGTNRNGAVVCKDGKCGLIDKTGNIVVPLEYDGYDSAYHGYFANGVVQLYKGDWETGKSYVMDSSGSIVIPPEYDIKWRSPKYGEPGVFFDGVAAVSKNDKWGYMDRDGKILLPLEYDEVGYASGGMGVVRQGSRYGIVDLNPAPASVTAMPTNDTLLCDGVPQTPTVYKINDSNYFKIRDLAAILNGTGKQFAVGYDAEKQSVTADTGAGYIRLDTDLAGAPAGGNKSASPSNDAIYINGVRIDAEVYKIDGSNYFKLRDLGQALDFYVGWDGSTGTVSLDTTRGYGEEPTPAADPVRDISDEELMAQAKTAVFDMEDMFLDLVRLAFLQTDINDCISVADILGSDGIDMYGMWACRAIDYSTIAEAKEGVREMWYRSFSRRYPFPEEYLEDNLAERNGKLYVLVGGVGDRGADVAIDCIVSRTAEEAIFRGHWVYDWDDDDMSDPFEMSLVFEDGTWKYGYLKDSWELENP